MDQPASDRPSGTGAPSTNGALNEVKQLVQACIQCGTCTASCPNAFAMDFTPRHLWRLVLMDRAEAIFDSKTFILCSSCYSCTLRCPRGLPLTEAMARLKQHAAQTGLANFRSSTLFYGEFMESVRRHGRVNEVEFMSFYFAKLKHPLVPLRFAPLGTKLMLKGKIGLHPPTKSKRNLGAFFKKVRQLENTA